MVSRHSATRALLAVQVATGDRNFACLPHSLHLSQVQFGLDIIQEWKAKQFLEVIEIVLAC